MLEAAPGFSAMTARHGGEDPGLAGYLVHWRDTSAARWTHGKFVGKVTGYTLDGLVIDNYLFGVSAIGLDGNRSLVVFPRPGGR